MVGTVAEACEKSAALWGASVVWGKRGWARLVCIIGIEMRFASWGEGR